MGSPALHCVTLCRTASGARDMSEKHHETQRAQSNRAGRIVDIKMGATTAHVKIDIGRRPDHHLCDY